MQDTGPFGRAVTLEGAGITSVEIGCDYEDVYFDYCPSVEIDDLAYSNVAQPDTEILPLADGRFVFVGNQTAKGFECSLDGATFAPCAAPLALRSAGRRRRTRSRCDDRPLRRDRHDAGGVRVDGRRPAAAAARAGGGRAGRGRRRRARRERQLPGGGERRPGRRRPGRRRRRLRGRRARAHWRRSRASASTSTSWPARCS